MRLVRTIKGFDALYLMTTSMKGSISVLFWSVVLLILVQMMMGLFLQMMLEPFVLDDSQPFAVRDEVFMFYGTFARSFLTMFEITLGNWMPPCRALVEHVHESYMVFFLCHKLIIGFSVVTVISGVFIQETFKVATTDDKIMLMQKERSAKTHRRKMMSLFEHADADLDGSLTIEEFNRVVNDPQVKTWLSSMGLDVDDVDTLFRLIDDGDEQLTASELIDGVAKLQGSARSIDLVLLLHEHRECKKLVQHLCDTLRRNDLATDPPPGSKFGHC